MKNRDKNGLRLESGPTFPDSTGRRVSVVSTKSSFLGMLLLFLTVDVVFRLLLELGRGGIQWNVMRASRESYCYIAFSSIPFFSHIILLFAPFTPICKGA